MNGTFCHSDIPNTLAYIDQEKSASESRRYFAQGNGQGRLAGANAIVPRLGKPLAAFTTLSACCCSPVACRAAWLPSSRREVFPVVSHVPLRASPRSGWLSRCSRARLSAQRAFCLMSIPCRIPRLAPWAVTLQVRVRRKQRERDDIADPRHGVFHRPSDPGPTLPGL
jgi:hypothetical protein